jgi:nucleoside triphosphate diphosphatase
VLIRSIFISGRSVVIRNGRGRVFARSQILPGANFPKVVELASRLRGPDGCPWDRAQNYDSIKALLLKEVYEVLDAVNQRDFKALQEELGDLLFQVVFYARLAEEEKQFNIDQVVEQLHDKLLRRHPHVFGTARAQTAAEALKSWNQVKQREREAKLGVKPGDATEPASLVDSFPAGLPATLEAYELGVRAAEGGFDWRSAGDVLDKIEEELHELRHELDSPEWQGSARACEPRARAASGLGRVEEEIGDLLFAAANLARFLRSDPESCVRRANRKFRQRFRALEQEVARRGKRVSECDPQELDEIWTGVKRANL